MKPFIMTYGKFKGEKITSSKIPLWYLRQLEEHLLLKGTNTSDPLMKEIDKEIRRREK